MLCEELTQGYVDPLYGHKDQKMPDRTTVVALTASALLLVTAALYRLNRSKKVSRLNSLATASHEGIAASKKEAGSGESQSVAPSNVSSQASGRISRHDIVRKLLADPNYRIEINETVDSVRSKIDETMKKVLWDIIEQEVKRKDFSKLIVLLREVRQKVNGLTPRRVDLHNELRGIVDIELTQRLLENDEISQTWLDSSVDFVVRKRLLVLESPARNKKTLLWLQEYKAAASQGQHSDASFLLKRFRSFLDFAHKKIEEIELDTANHQISCLAAIVEERGFDYYRELFEAGLQLGDHGLENTNKWISELSTRYKNKEYDLRSLHVVGILDIVIDNVYTETEVNKKVPETFGADWENLLDVARIMRGLCRTAICLLRLKQLLVRVDVSFEVLGKKIHALLLQRAPQTGVSVRGDHIYVSLVGDNKGGLSEKLSAKLVIECTSKVLAEFDEKLTDEEVKKLQVMLPKCLAGSRGDTGELVFSIVVKHNKCYLAFVTIVKRLHEDMKELLLRDKPLDELLRAESLNVRKLNLGRLLIDEMLQLSHKLAEIVHRDFYLHEKEYISALPQN